MRVAAILFFMGLLGLGATITPGVGLFGGFIVMLPQWVTELSHIPAYGILTWLLTLSLQRHGMFRTNALLAGGLGATLFGMGMEFCQAFVPGRVVDAGDVMLNSVGVVAAAIVMCRQPVSDRPAERRSAA